LGYQDLSMRHQWRQEYLQLDFGRFSSEQFYHLILTQNEDSQIEIQDDEEEHLVYDKYGIYSRR